MKKFLRWIILALFLAVGFGCFSFLFINVNRGIVVPVPSQTPAPNSIDPAAQEESIRRALRDAPWQGLRFLPEEKEWRFYGYTGETRTFQFSVPFDLIKVYYLEEDGQLSFTWVATGADIPGKGYYQAALAGVAPAELVAVRLRGEHVGLWGVDWEACDAEFCQIANMIDTILILDDRGTGISNGFIKYGWEPPTSPMYGFLCWALEPVGKPIVQAYSTGASDRDVTR